MPRMEQTIAPTAPRSTSNTIGWLFLIAGLGLLWFELINQLKAEWWLNPQYNYGLIVPLVVLYLIWRRWPNRPAPAPPAKTALPVLVIVFGAALFFPIRFLADANPDWRLLSWVLAAVVVSISLAFVCLIGGRPWLRHFAFPLLFFLVAVPWPVRIEQSVIQTLMRMVTTINVTFLQLAGVPALQHGNVIEVGKGFIGIEEACSGVRSLQATLMVSLFLGELYSFKPSRRFILVIVGALLAFICNVVRTAILVWAGTTSGPQKIEAWHDPAGMTILLFCLFGLWIASLIMQRRGNASPPKNSSLIDNGADGSLASGTGKPARVDEPGGESINRSGAIQFRPALASLLLIWLVAVEVGVQLWYGAHRPETSSRWAVRWPELESNYKSVPIAPAAETLLRYNEGGGAAWEGTDGRQWMMYFFRWLPGRTAARFLKVHRPDICLPASGRTMERDNGIRMLEVNGITLPVRTYRFDDRGVPLHVFYCYWDARSNYENAATAEFEDWSPRGRVRAALQGRREIGAQMLEIIVWGYHDDAEANEALARELGQVVRAG